MPTGHYERKPWSIERLNAHLARMAKRRGKPGKKTGWCWNKGIQMKPNNCVCLTCDKPFRRKPHEIKKGEGKYCSFNCKNIGFKVRYKGSGNPQFGQHWGAGENNPNWKGGCITDGYTWDWPQIKKMIKKRDNFKCRMCGVGYGFHKRDHAVHHIDENKKNNSPDNLITLCIGCHCKIHKPHLNSLANRKASEGGVSKNASS